MPKIEKLKLREKLSSTLKLNEVLNGKSQN